MSGAAVTEVEVTDGDEGGDEDFMMSVCSGWSYKEISSVSNCRSVFMEHLRSLLLIR